jgi:S-adenosylmethionine-dependent methyltransferase
MASRAVARSAPRPSVVWSAVRQVLEEPDAYGADRAAIVDIGGGTGGFAVPLAELGHQVLVVDPNPDALAALGRRAAEAGVTHLISAQQGDVADVGDMADRFTRGNGADLVLCHEVLEVLDDPIAALATIIRIMRPAGTLSLLVAGLHAAVVARAMTGHFHQAIALLDGRSDGEVGQQRHGSGHGAGGGRRFTPELITTMLTDTGWAPDAIHGARVFADLVPGALIDSEPGAAQALAELERAVSERSEYLALATHLHVLAHRSA